MFHSNSIRITASQQQLEESECQSYTIVSACLWTPMSIATHLAIRNYHHREWYDTKRICAEGSAKLSSVLQHLSQDIGLYRSLSNVGGIGIRVFDRESLT
jgi:hypothetical protein